MKRMKKLVGTIFMLLLTVSIWSQSIWTNPINDGNPSGFNPYILDQIVAGNITVSGISRGPGISPNAGSARYNATSWSQGAIDLNDYFQFTLTPNAGYQINFSSFVYTAQKSGTGPNSFAFRSSLDGYSANIGAPGVTSGNINLSAATYQGITSAITFRYYGWAATGASGTYSINDFTFNGTVTSTVANSISTAGTYTSYCNGVSNSVNVPYTAIGTYTGTFTAQLSDANGSFTSPTIIGTGASPISATIPAGIPAGTGYRIRVVNNTPNTIGTDNGTNIIIKESPLVNLGNDTSFCAGTPLNITLDAGNIGASYQWSNFSTSQTLNVSTAGNFSVIVTGANACVSTDQITVTENALPIVNLGNNLSYCAGVNFSQTLNAGNSGAAFLWNDASTLQTLNITQAGQYSVTVTNNNGCQNKDTVIVIENALPTVNIGPDLSYCTGTNFSQILDAGNIGATYNWNNGAASTQNFTVTTAGNYSVLVIDANGCENTDAITVTENALPIVDLGSNFISYCAGTNFSQTLDAGNPGATYNWNNGQANTQTFIVTSAGLYGVVVTDANGCQNVDGVVVTENAIPTVNLGSDLSYCVGSPFSQVLNAGNPGATYDWNNGLANTQTFTVTTAGTYKVKVTNGNGCENTDSVIVTENTLPTVNIGNDLEYCAGSNFSQVLNAGNPGSTYSWNNGAASTQTFTATVAGNYSVIVTDGNGCQNSDAIIITENALPIVNLGSDLAYCVGTSFSQILDAGNVGSTYNWNNGVATTQTFTATTSGNYMVQVTDANGCINTDDVTVIENSLPTVNLGNDLSYCVGSNFSQILDAGNAGSTFNWNNGTSLNQTLTVTQAGIYSVSVTDANGCINTDQITVTENALPVLNLGNDTAYCAGNAISLLLDAGNPGATYSWNGGGLTSQIFAVSQAGIYSVVVTNMNGCQKSDTVIVTENTLPIVNLGNDTSYCAGSPLSLVLNAGNIGSSYVWGNGSITQTVTATQAGTYMVTVTNANGCVNSDQLVVSENALPIIQLGNDVNTTQTSYILNAGNGFSSYLWNPGGQNTQQITVTQSGNYSVTVTNATGCSASDEITVTLGNVAIIESGTTQIINTIFPNPANEVLNIRVGSEGKWHFEIFSMDGKCLMSQHDTAYETNQNFSISLDSINSGTYLIKISNGSKSDSKIFIVNK